MNSHFWQTVAKSCGICIIQIYSPFSTYRVLKCDVIKFSFWHFSIFMINISEEHDQKPKFDMNLT